MDKDLENIEQLAKLDAALNLWIDAQGAPAEQVRLSVGKRLRWHRRLRVLLPLAAIGIPMLLLAPVLWASLVELRASMPADVIPKMPQTTQLLTVVQSTPLLVWVGILLGFAGTVVVLSER
ncbi:MAG: hypothetical protein AB8F65_09325 [Woeseiaceae bacterium]